MATFNPYTRATKETINVDFNDRHSPQKVILCNRENQFYGTFTGKVNTQDININGGTLSGVVLSDCTICDKNGVIDISRIADSLANICSIVDLDIPEISALAKRNESAIVDLSDAVGQLSVSGNSQLSALDEERKERISVDNELNGMISSNGEDIDTISSDLEKLSGKYSVDEEMLDRTFVSADSGISYGYDNAPDFLVLKDRTTGHIYTLQVNDGLLAIKKIQENI